MSKDELQEKVQKLATDIAKEIDVNLVPQTLILTELWQQCYDSKIEIKRDDTFNEVTINICGVQLW